MKTYDLCIRVPAAKLGTILELLEEEGEVLSIVLTREHHKKPVRWANGSRNKGITGADLVLELVQKSTITAAYARRVFIERGFAPNSSAAALSHLVGLGKIKRDVNGTFSLAKK